MKIWKRCRKITLLLRLSVKYRLKFPLKKYFHKFPSSHLCLFGRQTSDSFLETTARRKTEHHRVHYHLRSVWRAAKLPDLLHAVRPPGTQCPNLHCTFTSNSQKIQEVLHWGTFEQICPRWCSARPKLHPFLMSVQDCLSLFFEETILTAAEQTLCSACGLRREATVQTCLDKPPEILILHLKR